MRFLDYLGSGAHEESSDRTETVEKEAKTDAGLEELILQRLVIVGVFATVRPDASLVRRPTVNRTS